MRRLAFGIVLAAGVIACILAGTAFAQAEWQHPAAYTINTGSLNSGELADIYSVDGQYLVVDEITGTPGLDIRFVFSDIPETADALFLTGRYEGNGDYLVEVMAYNYVTSSWDYLITTTVGLPENDRRYKFELQTEHISDNGQTTIAITVDGTPNYQLYIDEIHLSEQPLSSAYIELSSGRRSQIDYQLNFGDVMLIALLLILNVQFSVRFVYDVLIGIWDRRRIIVDD